MKGNESRTSERTQRDRGEQQREDDGRRGEGLADLAIRAKEHLQAIRRQRTPRLQLLEEGPLRRDGGGMLLDGAEALAGFAIREDVRNAKLIRTDDLAVEGHGRAEELGLRGKEDDQERRDAQHDGKEPVEPSPALGGGEVGQGDEQARIDAVLGRPVEAKEKVALVEEGDVGDDQGQQALRSTGADARDDAGGQVGAETVAGSGGDGTDEDHEHGDEEGRAAANDECEWQQEETA